MPGWEWGVEHTSGPLLPLRDQVEVQAAPGLILEAVLWLVDACSVRPGLGAFFHPAFFQLFLYFRRIIRLFYAVALSPAG